MLRVADRTTEGNLLFIIIYILRNGNRFSTALEKIDVTLRGINFY
jgi:hypothetical protein